MIKFLFPLVLVFYSLTINAASIVVLGDSISAGYGMNKNQNWVKLLQKKIYAQKLNFTIHNESISGDTTFGGLSRIKYVLAKHKPNILLLELGANDGIKGREPQIIKTNLVKLVNRSRAAGAKVLLLIMRIPKNRKHGVRYSNMFYNTYLELSKDLNIPLVPFILEDVVMHKELMLQDRIHPNAQAQAHIVEDIWPYLMPMLK